MTILDIPSDADIPWDDVLTLRRLINDRGFDASNAAIIWAWQQHSDDFSASWLVIDGTEHEANVVIKWLTIGDAKSSPFTPYKRGI